MFTQTNFIKIVVSQQQEVMIILSSQRRRVIINLGTISVYSMLMRMSWTSMRKLIDDVNLSK